jgi:hypothetical protein
MRARCMVLVLSAAAIALAAVAAGAPAGDPIRVRYLSAEYVYLDAGRLAGLAEGDTLRVQREGRELVRLIVVYLADHSASCQAIGASEPLQPGDLALLAERGVAEAPPATGAAAAIPAAPAAPAARPGREAYGEVKPRAHGRIALQGQMLRADVGPTGSFSEPALRVDLSVPDLGLPGLDLELNGSLRHQHRPAAYSNGAPRDEWRNRIQTASLTFRSAAEGLRWSAGRVQPSVAGIGWIDGGLVEARAGARSRFGAFVGWEPDWRASGFSTDTRKSGLFASHRRGRPGERLLDLALAVVGLSVNGEPSRDYLHLDARAELGRDLGIQHSLELDINRGWRRDSAGEQVTPTGIFAGLRWRARPGLDLNLSYDARRLYRTAASRSLPDSLFADALRRSLRARGRLSLGRDYSLSMQAGLRTAPAGVDDTWSYGLALARQRPALGATVDVSGFSGPLAWGWRPSLSLSRPFAAGHSARIAGGMQFYGADGASGGSRAQSWLSGGLDLILARRLRAGGEYRYEWGDDTGGHRLFAELSYRF